MKVLIAKILAGLNAAFHTPVLTELFIAMLPIVELRGAIPIGVESGLPLWQAALIGFVGSSIPAPIILLALIPVLNALKKTRWFRKFATWIENKFKNKSDKLETRAGKNTQITAKAEDSAITTNKEKAETSTLPVKVVSAKSGIQVINGVAPEKPPEKIELTQEEIKLKKRRERIKLIGIYTFVAIPLPFTGVWTGSAVAAFLGLAFFKALGMIILGNLTAALIITLVTYLFKDYLWAVIVVLFGIIILIILGFIIMQIIKKAKRRGKVETVNNETTIDTADAATRIDENATDEEVATSSTEDANDFKIGTTEDAESPEITILNNTTENQPEENQTSKFSLKTTDEATETISPIPEALKAVSAKTKIIKEAAKTKSAKTTQKSADLKSGSKLAAKKYSTNKTVTLPENKDE